MTIIAASASSGPVSSAAGPSLSDYFPFLLDSSSVWPIFFLFWGIGLALLVCVYLEKRS